MADNKHEHEHVHGEGCDCGHDHEHQTVTLTLEDNTELECNIIGTFDNEDTEYIALLPVGSDEVLIYIFREEGGEVILDNVPDEDFDTVAELFNALLEEEEYEGEEE